jgi:hypothetical protein
MCRSFTVMKQNSQSHMEIKTGAEYNRIAKTTNLHTFTEEVIYKDLEVKRQFKFRMKVGIGFKASSPLNKKDMYKNMVSYQIIKRSLYNLRTKRNQ